MSNVQHLANRYNAARKRFDVEWIVTANGNLTLRDVPDPGAERRRAERTEAERQRFIQRNDASPPPRYPYSDA